jgi:long-chain acyl-CoA synthetase
MRRDTLLDFFEDFAPYSREFLVHDDGFRVRRFSYSDVARAAKAFAARLQAAGIGKGDKVLIWSENRPEWITALWGCLLNGTIVVPIDYRASFEFLDRVQQQVHARVALIGDEVVWAGRLDLGNWKLADFDWTGTGTPAPVAVSREDLAEIIFTSGATAEPKGVLIEHRNILANIVPVENEVRKYRKWGKPMSPIRFLNLLPLSHMFGQAMATFIPPMLPGTTIFLRGYSPDEIIRQIKTRRISVLVCVPKILEMLRDHVQARFAETLEVPAAGEHWLRRWWRFRRIHRLFGWKFWAFITGAAPLPQELEEFWSRLGFIVIQGYGLTETAPIVTLNHPFHMSRGTVGKPIGGVDVKIAGDGEVLVRGENVTPGYYGGSQAVFDAEGWFHTGDVGEFAADGSLLIRGRKKEMIVTPEGLNVFPEDVEAVLDRIPGVRESAVIGRDRVHAVLVLDTGASGREIVRQANVQLQDHQKIRSVTVWPFAELPRTEGTRKLRRGEIARRVESGLTPAQDGRSFALPPALARLASGRDLRPDTTLEELGLSSLERVELMMELGVKEGELAPSRTVAELVEHRDTAPTQPEERFEFPSWNRSRLARWIRNFSLETWILPIGRLFAWVHAEGVENLSDIAGPVIFAPNHQSHFDVPALLMALPWRWRFRVAPAMSKEFFDGHFHPERHSVGERFTNSLNYYLAALFFNTFPLPQRERSAVDALRYAGELAGDGWCILIFPEGVRTDHGEIRPFRAGVGMMASRLSLPVVPVRLVGLDRILHTTWLMARPGRARVIFGKPLRFTGDNYAAIAQRIEDAVRALAPDSAIL